MKNVSKAILASLVLSAAFLVSCDKEVTTSPLTVDKSQKATVKAYVYADLDQTNPGEELVPAGTRVILTIPYSSLGISGNTSNWTDTVETNAQGMITDQVPTTASGVTVTFTPIDFIADQVQPLGTHYTKISKLFQKTGTATTVTVKVSDSKIALIDYNTVTNLLDFDNLVTVSGKAFAELDDNSAGEENAPLIDVIFSGTGFSTKVTLTQNVTNTIFTVNLPNNVAINYSFDFIAQKNVSDGGTGWKKVAYRYKGTKSLATFTADNDAQTLDFGAGTLVQ